MHCREIYYDVSIPFPTCHQRASTQHQVHLRLVNIAYGMVAVHFRQQGQWHGQVDDVELAQAVQMHQQICHTMQHITKQLWFPPPLDHHKDTSPPQSSLNKVQHKVHEAKC